MKTPHPHRLTRHVKFLQKAALWHDSKVLILKRPEDDFSRAGKWDLPGGNSEWPTTITQDTANVHLADIIREIHEETGLKVTSDHIEFSHSRLIGTYFEPKKQLYSIIVGWRIDVPNTIDPQSVQLSSEHTQYTWIELAEFDQYDFGFAGNATGFIRKIVGL